MLRVDPCLAIPLKLIVDPIDKASNILELDPNRTLPNVERQLPSLPKLRVEIEDPKLEKLLIEKLLPNLIFENTLIADPILTEQRILTVLLIQE